EPTPHVRHITPGRLENAGSKARADPACAVRHDGTIGRELVRPLAKLLVRNVDSARRVSGIPLGSFAHVQEDRAFLKCACGGRSSMRTASSATSRRNGSGAREAIGAPRALSVRTYG